MTRTGAPLRTDRGIAVEPLDWPADFNGRPEVRGVWSFACVQTGRRFRRKAHAHTRGDFKGWVCYLSSRWLGDVMVARHELAHLITSSGHTNKWRRVVLALGGTLDETEAMGDCHERSRKPPRHRGMFNTHRPTCPCFERKGSHARDLQDVRAV